MVGVRFSPVAASLVLAAALLAACASGTTTVLEPAARGAQAPAETLRLVSVEDSVPGHQEFKQAFAAELRERLIDDGRFSEGGDLIVEYRVVQLDEGSRALRYVVGFGAGKGALIIEVRYLNAEGEELGRIHVGGEISGGLFGGGFSAAVDEAAREAAEYTLANF